MIRGGISLPVLSQRLVGVLGEAIFRVGEAHARRVRSGGHRSRIANEAIFHRIRT